MLVGILKELKNIVMVETYTSKIIAWSATQGIHNYADRGGGPNACRVGSDGAVYITVLA